MQNLYINCQKPAKIQCEEFLALSCLLLCSCLNLGRVAYRHAAPTTLQCRNIDNYNMSVHHRENIRYFTTHSMEYSTLDRLILPHLVNKLHSFDGT